MMSAEVRKLIRSEVRKFRKIGHFWLDLSKFVESDGAVQSVLQLNKLESSLDGCQHQITRVIQVSI